MMEYEIFKDVVKEKLQEYLSVEFKDANLIFSEAVKVNRTVDTVSIRCKNNNISPLIYMDDMYEHYSSCKDLGLVLQTAAANLETGNMTLFDIETEIFNPDTVKDNVYFQLINTEQNKELLSTVPHREFLDLSVIYRHAVSINEEGISSIIIRNNYLEQFKLNEEQLFEHAMENTRTMFPATVKSMNDIMRDMMIADGMPAEAADTFTADISEPAPMWVISNAIGINGAASMLYTDEIHKLSEKLKSDLYLLPSSIHEVIAVPSMGMNPDELASMVQEVNMNMVSLEERLSNQVYYYDKNTRVLSLATDSPQKRLDGNIQDFQSSVHKNRRMR